MFIHQERTGQKMSIKERMLSEVQKSIDIAYKLCDLLDLYDSPTDTVPQLHAFLATVARHREVLERQLEDLNATLEDLAQRRRRAGASRGIDACGTGDSDPLDRQAL